MSLLEGARDRIVEMIDLVKQASSCDFFVLIVDGTTVSTLSSILSMTEITSYGVALVESISQSRQPLPHLDAVYFLTPISYKGVVEDFSGKQPMYKSAHIFFCQPISQGVITELAHSDCAAYIQNLAELPLDFYLKDSNVYTFRMYDVFAKMYNGSAEDRDYGQIAKNLANVCTAVKELPVVYYATESTHACRVAGMFQAQIDAQMRRITNLVPNSPPATLIILDRVFDPVSPLLHDFHYESSVYDLLGVQKGGIVNYESTNTQGQVTQKQAILNEKDDMWMQYKYMHISDLASNLRNDQKNFLQDKSHIAKTTAGQANIEQLHLLVQDLPEYEETMSKFAIHTHLVDACLNQFQGLNLKDIAELEQTIATGVNEHGNEAKVSNMRNNLQTALQSSGISHKDRRRLLLLYTLCVQMSDKDRKTLMDSIPVQDAQLMANLRYFGVNFVGKSKTRSNHDKHGKIAAKRQARGAQHILTRAEYKMEAILEQACNGALPADKFRPIREDIATQLQPKVENTQSMRKKKGPAVLVQASAVSKLIVCVLGGVSYSELRIASKVSKNRGITIIIGGTEILSPNHFIEQIESTNPLSVDQVGLNLR